MKKFLLCVFALLISVSGVWADGLKVSTTESASAEYQYKIFCRNASDWYLGNTTNATNSGTDYGLFAFFAADGYDDGYFIYSVLEGKWVTYEASTGYSEGKNKISLSTEKPTVPWNIAADNADSKYYDIRAFKTDKTVALMSWNWHGGASNNTSSTMGFYGYDDGNSGWGFVLAGGSGSPVADKKVVAIYNRTPNENEYPITSNVNVNGRVLSSNSTSATPQLFVLRYNGIDDNGEAKYQLQKAEADDKYFRNDGTSPQANTYSETSSDFVFLNSSSPFASKYSAILKDGTTITSSPYYNLMARATYYGCIHSKNNNASFDGWTSNTNSGNKIQFYYADNNWNGQWDVKEQAYTAWQVVITGASTGSITYTGSNLLSGATTLQSNNGIYVLNATPAASDFTSTFVDGYLSDPVITIDNDRKLIKVVYTDYTTVYSTITSGLNAPEGIGYPTSAAHTPLEAAIAEFDASSKCSTDLATLNTAYNAFRQDVKLPELGKVYTLQNYIKSNNKTTYLKNEGGTLTIGTEVSETALNNLWIVRKSVNEIVLQSAADFTKYIVYNSFTLGATGSAWTLSYGTEWPYISMYNSTLGGGRYVACNGSDQFGTAKQNYYAGARTQYSGWSTDFKFVESPDYALYKVKILYPQNSSPTVSYAGTAYSNGGEFFAAKTLAVADLTASEVSDYVSTVSIVDDVVYVTYDRALKQTFADTWNFDSNPWAVLQEKPATLPTGRTYRYNTKRINVAFNSSILVNFNYSSGNYRIDVAGVDLINPSTGEVVKADYHDGYSGTYQSKRDYTIANVAPGDYILRYISYDQSTSSAGNITIQRNINKGFFRFNIGDNYMCNVASSDNVRTTTTTNNDASTIFYLNDANYLIAYADGYGFNFGYCKAASPGIFCNYEFVQSSTPNKYLVHSLASTDDNKWSNRYITVKDSHLDEGSGEWSITEVTSLPVTISASGWATFYAPVAVTIPSGVTAYTATVSGTELTKVEVPGTTIPAGTGVLLYADINEATTYNFDVAEDVTAITGNAFTGTTPTINKPSGDVYVLAKGNSGLGFYKYAGTTLAGFKAYIPASALGGGSASFVGFADDDITAVDAVIVNGQILNDQYYDLQGRKVAAPQKGQLYIHNGKKVLY